MDEMTRHATRGEPYRGYAIPYCGLGTLIARRPDGSEIRVDAPNKVGPWLDTTWARLKAIIDGETDA